MRTLLFASLALFSSAAWACSKPIEGSRQAAPNSVSQGVEKQTAKIAADDARTAELRKVADGVLHSIETGDADRFISFVSKEGVCFGIDCDAEPLEQMRKDLSGKNGFYCLLFDTECERRTVLEMWKKAKHKGDISSVHSFRDSLKSSQIKETIFSSETTVSFEFEDRDESSGHKSWTLDLVFAREGGAWKLIGFQ